MKVGSCTYFHVLSRLAQEGSLMTIPFMTKRTIRPSVKDLEILLLSSDTEMPPSHDQLVSTKIAFPFFDPSMYCGAQKKVCEYCFMKQKCQIEMGIAHYKNVATPLKY